MALTWVNVSASASLFVELREIVASEHETAADYDRILGEHAAAAALVKREEPVSVRHLRQTMASDAASRSFRQNRLEKVA